MSVGVALLYGTVVYRVVFVCASFIPEHIPQLLTIDVPTVFRTSAQEKTRARKAAVTFRSEF